MALDTYSALKTSLGTWAYDRTDLPTADFVTLVEADLRADTTVILRTEESDNSLTGSIGSRTITLPTGFVRPITLWRILDNGDRSDPLQLVNAADMQAVADEGIPEYWAIDGANLVFERPLDSAYSFKLRAEINLAALSDSATTNYLLTNYPQVYLSGGNLQAALYLQDAEQIDVWSRAYSQAKQMVARAEAKSRGDAPLRTEVASVFSAGRGYDIATDR